MITIQCTKKLAAELKVSLPTENLEQAHPLYGWHAHLFTFKRRKCVLVMNNESRYNFMMYGMVRADFQRFSDLIIQHISENLLADGMKPEWIDKYLHNHRDVRYASTSDRSIIGQMNEVIMVSQYIMEGNLVEFGEPRWEQVNREMNKYVFLKLPKLYSGVTMRDIMKDL